MERNDQVRNSHLVTPNKITDLGTDHKEMLRSESEVAQSCLTLCNPMDCSLSGSSVYGIFQARVLDGLPFPSPCISWVQAKNVLPVRNVEPKADQQASLAPPNGR